MSDPKHDERHHSVWLLLPWYANGTLETAERLLVEDHLAACLGCREEVARCNSLAAALRDRPEIAPSPHPLQLARLIERLDALEAGKAGNADNAGRAGDAGNAGRAGDAGAAGEESDADDAGEVRQATAAAVAHAVSQAPAGAGGARFRQRGGSLLGGTPRPVRWALAGQLAAMILLATALAFGPARRQPAGARYVTLSAPAAALSAPATAPQIRLVFADTATAKQMREVLLSTRGRVVDGPSPLGAYTLELPAPAPAPAAALPGDASRSAGTGDLAPAPPVPRAAPREAAPDSVGIVLAYLHAQPIVRFAEPVAGTGTPPASPPAPAVPVPGTAAVAPRGTRGTGPKVPPA